MITAQFVRGKDFASKAIAIFERGTVTPSHVDVVWPDGRLFGARSDVLGGAPPGVQFRTPDYEPWAWKVKVSLSCTSEQESLFYAFLMYQQGKPYDKTAIAAFVFGRDWRSPEHWFCSELYLAALEACKWFPKPLSDKVELLTPRDGLLLVSPWAL